MATVINVLIPQCTIKIDQAFVSGKYRISVNGSLIYEGKMKRGVAMKGVHENREISVRYTSVGSMSGSLGIKLQIEENQEVIHSGLYDQAGNPFASEEELKKAFSLNIWALVFTLIGTFVAGPFLRETLGAILAGAIGGGLGALIGLGIGKLAQGK